MAMIILSDVRFFVATVLFAGLLGGCAYDPVYTPWAEKLNYAGLTPMTTDDVSLLLGTPPSRCDDIAPTPSTEMFIGNIPARDAPPEVLSLWPDGAASMAGIRKGDIIHKIGDTKVSNLSEAIAAVREQAKFDQPLTVVTNRGVHTIVPRRPKEAKQCYWEVSGGMAGKSGGFGYADNYGATAGTSSSFQHRFFRATCKFWDGKAAGCNWNYQK